MGILYWAAIKSRLCLTPSETACEGSVEGVLNYQVVFEKLRYFGKFRCRRGIPLGLGLGQDPEVKT